MNECMTLRSATEIHERSLHVYKYVCTCSCAFVACGKYYHVSQGSTLNNSLSLDFVHLFREVILESDLIPVRLLFRHSLPFYCFKKCSVVQWARREGRLKYVYSTVCIYRNGIV